MPNTRDLNLEKYGISKWLYRELRSFCMQYEDKKARLAFGIVDQERACAFLRDCEAVEYAARIAANGSCSALLYGETHDVRYFYLTQRRGLSVSEREYREMRHRFYFELAKKLKKI